MTQISSRLSSSQPLCRNERDSGLSILINNTYKPSLVQMHGAGATQMLMLVKCPYVCASGGSVCCGGVSCCGQAICFDFLTCSFLHGLCDAAGDVMSAPCVGSYVHCNCANPSVVGCPSAEETLEWDCTLACIWMEQKPCQCKWNTL